MKSRKLVSAALKPKCKRMADQIDPIDVDFLTIVFLEITGQ